MDSSFNSPLHIWLGNYLQAFLCNVGKNWLNYSPNYTLLFPKRIPSLFIETHQIQALLLRYIYLNSFSRSIFFPVPFQFCKENVFLPRENPWYSETLVRKISLFSYELLNLYFNNAGSIYFFFFAFLNQLS